MSELLHGRIVDVVNIEYQPYTSAESNLKANLAEMTAKINKEFAKLEGLTPLGEFPAIAALMEAFATYTNEVDRLSGLLTEEDLAKGLYWDFVYGYVNFSRALDRMINIYTKVAEIANAN